MLPFTQILIADDKKYLAIDIDDYVLDELADPEGYIEDVTEELKRRWFHKYGEEIESA